MPPKCLAHLRMTHNYLTVDLYIIVKILNSFFINNIVTIMNTFFNYFIDYE